MTDLKQSQDDNLEEEMELDGSEIEEEVEYSHPELPDFIKLRKKVVKLRETIFKDVPMHQEILNEKKIRCLEYQALDPMMIPPTFSSNSNKEELVLQHVNKYENQFRIAYDDNRELLMAPFNEYNTKKFVCTTIRPTKLGYIEFYNYKQCADYISSFIHYEPLESPIHLPTIVPSPSSVIQWQKGDCVDISILLCSFLIGVGYDAYCVVGTAPREITLKNESLMTNPYENEGMDLIETKVKTKDVSDDIIYKPQAPPSITSKYDQTMEENQRREEADSKKKGNDILDDDEPDRLPLDPFVGKRVHCWVLIKKDKRDLKEDVFIEPSTGRTWSLNEGKSPYLKVSQCFSNKNFYINLRPEIPIEDLDFDTLDNGESDEWEYAMIDTIKFPSLDANGDDLDMEELNAAKNAHRKINPKLNQVQNVISEIAHLIDMPMPWAPKLYIEKDQFLKGSLYGEVTRFYRKSRVDFYTKYSQIDGMTKRIVFFDDFNRMLVREVRCIYECRRNNLVMRRRFPMEFKTLEYYNPNNKPLDTNNDWPHWKSIEEVDRQKRIIKYYPYRHDDGLIERREIIKLKPSEDWNQRKFKRGDFYKTQDFFSGRDDYMEYRSFRYVPCDRPKGDYQDFTSNWLGKAYIVKMTQTFGRNRMLPANDQIQKMTIDLDSSKNRITVFYHLNDGEIAPICKVYERSMLSGMVTIPDGSMSRNEDPEDQIKQQKILNKEKECLSGIKEAEKSNHDDINDHRTTVENKINSCKATNNIRESLCTIIEKTLHDRAREKSKNSNQGNDDDGDDETDQNDILAPYWDEKIPMDRVLDYSQANRIKNDVLTKFKDRIVSRADIIDKRIKTERQKLDEWTKNLERKAVDNDNKKDKEKFKDQINQLKERVKILENRAQRFEFKAAEKFKKMQKDLLDDPRLARLKNKE